MAWPLKFMELSTHIGDFRLGIIFAPKHGCFGAEPSLELASCCKVDVVNGAAGFLIPGVFEISLTTNSAGFRLFKNSFAASSVSNF